MIISIDTARRQAAERGHTLQREVQILLVHGVLHLLGHDHESGGTEAIVMASEEARLNLPHEPPGDFACNSYSRPLRPATPSPLSTPSALPSVSSSLIVSFFLLPLSQERILRTMGWADTGLINAQGGREQGDEDEDEDANQQV